MSIVIDRVLVLVMVVAIYIVMVKDTAVLNRPSEVKRKINFAIKEHVINGFQCGER